MDGSVPAILWYVLVVAFFVWMVVALSIQSWRDHTARMTALDIQRTYAEKGVEPPVAATEQMGGAHGQATTHEWGHKSCKFKHRKAGHRWHFEKFGGDLFLAGVMAGLYWWRSDVGGPQWAIYVTGIAAAVFAIGAAAHFIGGIVATVAGGFHSSVEIHRQRQRDDDAG